MKKYIVLLFLLNHLTFYCFGQRQAKIDSLLQVLKVAKQQEKVNILNELCFEYSPHKPNIAIEYGNQAMELAQKLNFGVGTARSLRYIGIAYEYKEDYMRAQKNYFIALSIEEGIDNYQGIAESLFSIARVYNLRGDYPSALAKYDRAYQVFREVKDKKGILRVYNGKADVYYKVAKFSSALKFARKSLELAQDVGFDEQILESTKILSEAYHTLGNDREAYNMHLLYTTIKDSLDRIDQKLLLERMAERHKKEIKVAEEKRKEEKDTEIAQRRKSRNDNLQHLMIVLFFAIIFLGVNFVGKFHIPTNIIDSIIFVSVLLLFRFLLLLIVPFADDFSGMNGSPLFLLIINVVLAIIFMPVHKFLEKVLKKRAIRSIEKEEMREKLDLEEEPKDLRGEKKITKNPAHQIIRKVKETFGS